MLGGHKEADGAKAAPKAVFYDLPDMTVNLSASPERPQYLRVKITLEAEDNAGHRRDEAGDAARRSTHFRCICANCG